MTSSEGIIEWWTRLFARGDAPHVPELILCTGGLPDASHNYSLEDFDVEHMWRTLDETISRASIGKVVIGTPEIIDSRVIKNANRFYRCVLPRTLKRLYFRS